MNTYRNIELLDTRFRDKVKLFLKEVGDKIFITESYRSKERQKYLYSLGRTRPGNKVTWTLNSNHNKGIAIDIAFRGNDLYPSNIYDWKEIAEVANKYGIDWGYDLWKTDKPHFQDNGKDLVEVVDLFDKNSRFGKFIDLSKKLSFNDFKDIRPATIADIKELITINQQRTDSNVK